MILAGLKCILLAVGWYSRIVGGWWHISPVGGWYRRFCSRRNNGCIGAHVVRRWWTDDDICLGSFLGGFLAGRGTRGGDAHVVVLLAAFVFLALSSFWPQISLSLLQDRP